VPFNLKPICCPNSNHWKWIDGMENRTLKFCSHPLLFQLFDHGAALKISVKCRI